MIVQNFGTKFLLRRGECKTRENSNFWKKGKIVISDKTQKFSRSQMMKRISALGNPTVRTLRDKKEGRFTHRGLRMDSSFKEF